ncbi:MAG: tetratricopeptide repeat protein, partial [Planctomycetota bacterium]
MKQPFRGLQVATSLACTGLFAFVLAMGFFGCQGCQSGEGTDYGSPEKLLENGGKTDADRSDGGKTEPGDPPEPAPTPKMDQKEKALVEKIEFVENTMLRLARIARESGKKTRDLVLEEVKAHPEDTRYIYLHAELLLSKGEFAEARKLFEKALEKDPEFWPAWKGIALSWVKEDREKAREALEHLYSPEVPGSWGLLLIGEFFETGDKKSEAEEAFEKARKAFPNSVHPLIKLMQLHGVNEAWEKAFHYSEMALKRAPKNQKAWYFKGQLHLLRAMKARDRDPRVREQHKLLAEWLQDPKRPVLDRTEIAGGFRIIRSRDPKAPQKYRSLAVPGLIGGFKACLANFIEKKDEDETFLFQDIL